MLQMSTSYVTAEENQTVILFKMIFQSAPDLFNDRH